MTSLLLLALPAWAAAPLTPPVLLPGDDIIGQAAGTQDEPVLLEGDGATWLAVWRDTRASLADTLSSSTTDVYAIRIDADGVPLDLVSTPVASGPWAESTPRGAWNGTDWLVAFEAQAATAGYYSQGIYACRVGSDGVGLDTTNILLMDDDNQDEQLWDVASDGSSWAVLWQGVDTALGSYVTDGVRVGADGTPEPTTRVYTPASSLGAPVNLRIVWGQDRYMAAFSAWGNDDDIRALPLDTNLSALSAAVGVAADGYSAIFPSIAAGDDGFYVAWYDDSFGAYWTEVQGTPIDSSGHPTLANAEVLSGTEWPLDVHPDVAWMGAGWGAAWEWGAAAGIYTSLMDSAGGFDSMVDVSGSADYTRTPTVSGTPDGMLVGWATYGELSDFDVEVTSVSASGALGRIEPVSLATPAQTHPAIAGTSTGYLLVAESQTADDVAILAWRLDGRGSARDTAPIEIARGTGLSDPAVAWNGTEWLVVWTDLDPSTAGNGTVGVRVSPAGSILDATPIQIMSGYWPAVGASTSGDFLVAAAVPDTYDTNRLRGVRVSSVGAVLDATPLVLGTNYAVAPDVAPLGTGWVVTWARYVSHDDSRSAASYTVVSATGTVGVESRVRTVGSLDRETGVSVASDGTNALVVWSDYGDIRGRLIDSAGTLLGNGRGVSINTQANTQFDPDVAWNGSTYAVTWTDYRRHTGLEPGEGDVYTTPVTTTGRVGTATGIEATAEDVPEGNAVVAGANGRTVYAWTRLLDSPYGSFRVETSTQAARRPPAAE